LSAPKRVYNRIDIMPIPKVKGRYEVKDVLAEGGMGVIYKAFDKVMKRQVALKTLLDITDKKALQLFKRECEGLASLIHPNIVEIYDVGEFEEGGTTRPYLVMPLLPGVTLDVLIRESSPRLTVERSIDMICQACRGLQAAHDKGFVHRDVKPSNILVLEDDSVKIIDFGVAYRTDATRTRGMKGTLLYMAPEQIENKPLSAASDIFSLGVVCYETLTRRRPFERPTEDSVLNAILKFVPPTVSELNPAVNQALSQAIHKAMAKQPWHRYSSAKEFSDTLQKALRNEPIEMFNPVRIRPRMQRASEAYDKSDYQLAAEILNELEAEGYLNPSITELRQKTDEAIRKKTIAQLLDSARTRMEEDEYPLALQRVHEVLQMEPNHTEALALKSKIENKRTEGDINEWFRLARQHIDGFAFQHAREALQRILKLRPKEGRALQLISEVDRLEQEYVRIRQEKEQLYQAAVEADQRHDISSAMTKLERVLDLDRRAPEIIAPGRATTYQNLYNKVRSEHEGIKAAYAEAQRHLENQNFEGALSICAAHLTKYPGYALFQALKIDIEEQHRQALSARIAEIDRKVEAEADLNRRVSILEQAVRDNPREPHFEQLRQRTIEKCDLVESIVARARSCEQAGQFGEAVAQWEILQTIYSRYPGLNLEIERMSRRREQQLRTEAKARWVEQIDRLLEAMEYTRALEAVGKAQQEFPGDTELAELEKLARRGMDRAEEARHLLAEGRRLCEEQRFEQGLETLWRAYELDNQNPAVRALLLDTLVERARMLVDQDPAAAEPFLRQALDLEPGHSLAKGLLGQVRDHQRQEFVDHCVSQARQLQAAGDMRGAAHAIDQGLAVYPDELRMTQLQISLYKGLQDMRRRDLEEVRRISRESETVVDSPTLQEYSVRLEELTRHYSGDEEFESAARPMRQRLGTVVRPGDSEPVTGKPKGEPKTKKKSKRSTTAITLGAAGVVGAIVLGVGIAKLINRMTHTTPVPAATEGILEITTDPPGAAILVNNKESGIAASPLELKLAPGPLQIEARLPGFQPAHSAGDVKGGSRTTVTLTLVPVLSLKLLCAGNVKAAIDSEEPVQVQDGQLVRDFSSGKHSVKVTTPGGEGTFSFEVVPGGPAVITEPPKTREMAALLVSNFGEQARIYSSSTPQKVKLDDQPVGDVTPEGLDLPKLSAANHVVELGEGKNVRKKVIDIGPARVLTAIIDSDPNTGTLVVEANQEDADIIILAGNKEVRRGQTKNGRYRRSLEAKTYTVRASKEGYDADPPELQVDIQKGEDSRVAFKFQQRIGTASVSLRSNPGAELFLDNKQLGTVPAEGVFNPPGVAPGKHTVEARLKGFKPRQETVELVAGKDLRVIDLRLERNPGAVEITRHPAESAVTYVRAGESTPHVFNGNRQTLPDGDYTFMARAAGYDDKTVTMHVAADGNYEVDLRQTATKRGPVRAAPSVTMDDWGKGVWTQDTPDDWYQRHGGGYVLFPKPLGAGALQFSVSWEGGGGILRKSRAQWVVNYADEKNHLLCELDEEGFQITQVTDGKRTKLTPKKIPVPRARRYTIRVEVRPDSIVHRVQKGSGWDLLETTRGSGLATGKFGFLIPSGQDLYLMNFSFQPGS
jgi:serine/threonine-protein kinase